MPRDLGDTALAPDDSRGGKTSSLEPDAPRPAATIVVGVPKTQTFEVLLLQRPRSASFGAGAWAFPGGAIDDDDARAVRVVRIPDVGEPVACAAALRELFEETGIVPGYPPEKSPGTIAAARRMLLSGEETFSELARRLRFDLSTARVVYFARWITPREATLRFDTRFFLLALERQPLRVQLTSEHDAALWISPEAALRRFAAKDLPMMFPTVRTMERLAGFPSLEGALRSLRDLRVEPALVRLRGGRRGVTPLAPGDPGYDDTP